MKQITKSYLEYLGITDVTPDGTVYTKNGPRVSRPNSKGRLRINLHDPDKYKNVPKEQRNSGSGYVFIQVHQIVYAWFHGEVPYGKEIHHVDLNHLNNHITNLEALTPEEHWAKHRPKSTKQIKCDLKKPLSFYENKLNQYLELYEEAKKSNDTKERKNLRINIYFTRARIRYWKAHQKEAEQIQKETLEEKQRKIEWHNENRDLNMIKALAKQAKTDSDLHRWHQLNQIARNWKSYDSELKEQLIQVILKGHNFKD